MQADIADPVSGPGVALAIEFGTKRNPGDTRIFCSANLMPSRSRLPPHPLYKSASKGHVSAVTGRPIGVRARLERNFLRAGQFRSIEAGRMTAESFSREGRVALALSH